MSDGKHAAGETANIRILIVEDSPTQARRLERLLEQKGYAVVHAANGLLALEQAHQRKPALIISDVVMPQMDGYELCRRIKGEQGLSDIPVILVTTLSDPGDVIRGVECGADHFLLKPYDAPTLLGRVEYVLMNREMRQPGPAGPPVEIFFNGQRHRITADRLQILDLLLSTYDAAIQRNKELSRTKEELAARGAVLAQRETQLNEANSFLENLIAASPSIVFRLEPSGDDFLVTYVSPNIGWVLGYGAEEVVGVPHFWRDIVHPDDRGSSQTALRAALDGITTQLEQEYRWRAKNGAYQWFLLMMRVEYDDHAAPVAMVCHALDITDRKTAKLEAERANRAKSDFLSRMSHDLRTPLNAILGFAQLLELDQLREDQYESLRHILKGGAHLLDLINEVLDIARIESGHLSLSPEPVAIAEIVQHVVELLRPLALQREIAFDDDGVAACAGHYVMADRQRLNQILINLLSNAVKYNRHGGRVSVTCEERAGDRVRVNVTDTGPGIPPGKLKLLFQPFERLGAEQTSTEGTGLGLALSKALADAMGGALGVESVVDRGCTFWLELGAAETPPQAASQGRSRREASEGESRVSGTVLYIEDNASNVRLMERVLSRRPGVRLLGAGDGQTGLDVAASERPDLILLDLHLPDMPGEKVLRRLWEEPLTREIPVAVLSADASPAQSRRLLASGASAYLTKPLDIGAVLQLVDQRLGGEPSE